MKDKPMNPLLALAIVLALMAGIVWAAATVYQLTSWEFVLGAVGIAVTLVTALLQFRSASIRDAKARLFPEKSKAYGRLFRLLMDMLHAQKTKTPIPQSDLEKELYAIKTDLFIWGSARTIRALDHLGETKPNGSPTQFIEWIADLLEAVRKDLDHSDPRGAATEMAIGLLQASDRPGVRAMLSQSRSRTK